LFTERIGIAHRQRGRHALRKIKWITNLDKNLVSQIFRSRKVQRGKRIRTVGTIKNDFTECSCFRKCPDLAVTADGLKPRLRTVAVRCARTHHDLLFLLEEFRSEGGADHAGAKDCDFHKVILRGASIPASSTYLLPRFAIVKRCLQRIFRQRRELAPFRCLNRESKNRVAPRFLWF